MSHTLIWFRNDLRISDNKALNEALNSAKKVSAVYVMSREQLQSHGAGDVKLSVLEFALNALAQDLAHLGVELEVIFAPSWISGASEIASLVKAGNITAIYSHFEPGLDEQTRDRHLKDMLPEDVSFHRYNDVNLLPPHQALNKQGGVYKVFTAYKKGTFEAIKQNLSAPLAAPDAVGPPVNAPTIKLDIQNRWTNPLNLAVTEANAHERLNAFIDDEKERQYSDARNFPAIDGTSCLSVALSIGSISSRQILWALNQDRPIAVSDTYYSEIIWRDFYKYLTYHRPDLCLGKPFNPKWDTFKWRKSPEHIKAWQEGKTGVPIVDAAMRQLNTTGWMHNRLRMIVGMYLVKILQIDWRIGEAYFAEKLADFDFSANNGGWQWLSSTGVDAAPYFRIFNPYEQSRRFDGKGDFIRQQIPELADLGDKEIHELTPMSAQMAAYPSALVDYKHARADTLAKFKAL